MLIYTYRAVWGRLVSACLKGLAMASIHGRRILIAAAGLALAASVGGCETYSGYYAGGPAYPAYATAYPPPYVGGGYVGVWDGWGYPPPRYWGGWRGPPPPPPPGGWNRPPP